MIPVAIAYHCPMNTPPSSGLVLALGGGGARGLAHLGVLQVLEREKIPVLGIAGTSMGGLLGALYAASVPLDVIETTVAETAKPTELLSMLGISKSGISVRGQKLYALLVEALGGDLTFDELRFPLALVAADLLSGRRVVLNDRGVVDAVRATIAIPGVFEPVIQQGPGPLPLQLIDGGVLDSVPVSAAREMAAGPVVAVDVLPCFDENPLGEQPTVLPLELGTVPAVFSILLQTGMMAIGEMTSLRLRLHPPDLLLRPEIEPSITILTGFDHAEETIAAGRRAAEARLPELRRLAGM